MSFLQAVRQSMEPRPEPHKFWYYVPFEDKETGQFTGAILLEAESAHYANFAGIDKDHVGRVKVEFTKDIPDALLPAEEFRNRFLTPDEIKSLWPDAQ